MPFAAVLIHTCMSNLTKHFKISRFTGKGGFKDLRINLLQIAYQYHATTILLFIIIFLFLVTFLNLAAIVNDIPSNSNTTYIRGNA